MKKESRFSIFLLYLTRTSVGKSYSLVRILVNGYSKSEVRVRNQPNIQQGLFMVLWIKNLQEIFYSKIRLGTRLRLMFHWKLRRRETMKHFSCCLNERRFKLSHRVQSKYHLDLNQEKSTNTLAWLLSKWLMN